jgi:hypothetical protein
VIDSLNILQAVNTHQVISGDVNPARAEEGLAPRPETLPATKIHAVSKAKSETLEARKDSDFFRRGNDGVRHDESAITQITRITDRNTSHEKAQNAQEEYLFNHFCDFCGSLNPF